MSSVRQELGNNETMAKGESEYDNGHVPHSKGNAIVFFQSDDAFMIYGKFLKD